MKILFILGAYKPRASANGLCAINVIEQLKANGHSVTVLANQNIGCSDFEIENGISVYRVKPRLYSRLSEYSSIHKNDKPFTCKVVSCLATALNKILLFITSPIWPIVSTATNRRFSRMAKKLQKANDFDAVIAVYTPVEALLAGYEVKKAYSNVKYIPYFLDSLSGGYGPKIFSKERIIKRGLSLEKRIFEVADKIVLMRSSEQHQIKYNSSYKSKMIFLDIPMLTQVNGRDNNTPCTNNISPYKLLFVGSISRNIRNPKTLIDALLCINNDNIVCEFVGNIDCVDDFAPLKNKMGDRLVFGGFIGHDKLIDKISQAHVLINIGNNISTMVPSKIFEYMSYLKPIISTYDIKDEPSAKYLSHYPTALLLSGDSTPVENALLILQFLQNIHNTQVNYKTIEKQFYSNTPKAFADEIDKLLGCN